MTPDDAVSDPAFDLQEVFSGVKDLLGLRPGNPEELARNALIALDTNTLLVPYATFPASLDSIISVLRELVKAKRLIVPSHVLKEFVRQRPSRLGEVHAALEGRNGRFSDTSRMAPYPFLDKEPSFRAVVEIEADLRKLAEKHRIACQEVRRIVAAWGWDDPVSAAYAELLSGFSFQEPEIGLKDLTKEFSHRAKLRIPPGFKDAAKDSNGAGDFIIWQSLIAAAKTARSDLLFVTGERKTDWWVRSGGGVLWPRPELVAEFSAKTDGHRFGMVDLGELLKMLKAPEEVVRDVERAEVEVLPPIETKANSIPSRLNPLLSDVVEFDYSGHDGRFRIGDGDGEFETQWSKGSKTGIYCYSDRPSISGVALLPRGMTPRQIPIPDGLDFTSRVRMVGVGECVILRNVNGLYAAITVLEIRDRSRGDTADLLKFRYWIRTDGACDFPDIYSDCSPR